MHIDHVTETIATTGQITSDDMPLIAAHGFKSIVCNRPDGEDIDQQLFNDISQSARNLDIVPVYLPIAKDGPSSEDIETFKTLCDNLPKPILAYCATGGRSRKLLNVPATNDR